MEGSTLEAAAPAAKIQRKVAGDPSQKGKQILSWLMGRDRVPGAQVGVALAFLGVPRVLHDTLRKGAQPRAEFFPGMPDG